VTTIVNYHNRHLIGWLNWIVMRVEEAICASSIQFHQAYTNERIRMCPYKEGFQELNGDDFFCSRDSQNPRSYRKMDHLGTQVTSRFSMYIRRAEFQLMCRIPTWEWTVFVVSQFQLGVSSTGFAQ
jgi:hypothetical protein